MLLHIILIAILNQCYQSLGFTITKTNHILSRSLSMSKNIENIDNVNYLKLLLSEQSEIGIEIITNKPIQTRSQLTQSIKDKHQRSLAFDTVYKEYKEDKVAKVVNSPFLKIFGKCVCICMCIYVCYIIILTIFYFYYNTILLLLLLQVYYLTLQRWC